MCRRCWLFIFSKFVLTILTLLCTVSVVPPTKPSGQMNNIWFVPMVVIIVVVVMLAAVVLLLFYKRGGFFAHGASQMDRSFDTETAPMLNGSTTVGTSLNEMLEFSNSGSGSG